ncbi:hypothetical protein [Enterobacter hormaechei]|uniref:hypothetical protein n=1 Tax=Enterobacter hormaechei TaxID=158836 RepID=UPI003D36D8CA
MNSNATPYYLKTKTLFTYEQLKIEMDKRGLSMLDFKDYVAIKSRGKYGWGGDFYKVYRAHVGAMSQRDALTVRDWKRIVFWAGEFAAARGESWEFTGGDLNAIT